MKLFVLTLLFALTAGLAQAKPASLDALSAYLTGLDTVKTRFVQTNADGSKSRGTLFIKRPGRARFEYDDLEALVVAGGGQVAIFDSLKNTSSDIFPLRRTPLNLILARNVNLRKAKMVTAHGEFPGGQTVLDAQDPKNPEYGTIRLFFDRDPLALAGWVITSETGEKTRVDFEPFQPAGNLSTRMFNIPLIERERGG
ncbi:MAG: outer membrane lipoprotein carrier protein LolA [Rhodobacteraceae bacterium]|nr:outer membrane lipoprotein carrier protein LolA [Paracoccaceae bacterium]